MTTTTVLNAHLAHVVELVCEQRFVADGHDGFRHEFAEGPHTFAVSRRQNHALIFRHADPLLTPRVTRPALTCNEYSDESSTMPIGST